jgi:long-chain acyl-CoA synthetase
MAIAHAGDEVEIITFGCCEDNGRYERLLERGRQRARERNTSLDELSKALDPDGLATIIYTSGSTGLPKGVKLTQRNITSQIETCSSLFVFDPARDRILSTLPLAHIFERMVMYLYLYQGLSVYFVDNPKELSSFVRSVQPTSMTAVPRILEKVHEKMRARVESMGGIKGALAKAAVARAAEKDPDRSRRNLMDGLYEKLVYPTLRQGLGGQLHTVISGSAKLPSDLCRFFINIGVPIYEGYGLTESSPVIAVNTPQRRKVGTVGPPLPDVEVAIGSDGEVLARGPNIMQGYHNRPDATADTIDEQGWLHTGDLGSLDAEGFLAIRGRKKEIFKKSTGEYVPPGPIEDALSRHPLVDTAVIFADNRVYVTALLFPDMERLAEQKRAFGMEDHGDSAFLDSDAVAKALQEHIEEVNRHRHHCERVERFRMVHEPATVDGGELTPTLKVKREVVTEKYGSLVEEMYAQMQGWK